jgi:AmmeMemoRadiSam system protein A
MGEAVSQNELLTRDEEKTLLHLARYVLDRFTRDGTTLFAGETLDPFEITEDLRKPAGVFVTYHSRGQLRGCIGNILPTESLVKAVIENAMHSAAHDPRFDPIQPDELGDIQIEISVMSPLIPVKSTDEVEVGRDGLVLRAAGRTGVFLPQVPVEWHWERQEYLEQLGRKAGLDGKAYKRKDAELWRFTAQVFSEGREMGHSGA